MRIGVCIPCHKPYIQYIQKCLESIENQIRKPDIVSISISELDEELILPTFSFPIELTITSTYQCQAINRNIAASKIDVDILSFFDVDDIMHPNRLASIELAFQKEIDGFLHDNKQCNSGQYRIRLLSNIIWESISNNIYTDGFSLLKDNICGRILSNYGSITNGHFSCKQSVWKSIPFPEKYGLGEDCEYVYRIYSEGYKLGYTPDKLSYYIRDDFPEDKSLTMLDSYNQYTSTVRPPVYTNYKNTEIINVISFLLSEKSPERILPIFIVDQIHEFQSNTLKKILYNIEQMTRETMLKRNINRMQDNDIVEIWDYSISNYNILKKNNISVKYVPFKLSIDKILEYRSLHSSNKIYDIAFCGQIGPYRKAIIDKLKIRGKNLLILDNNYTILRDIEIGKAKLLINIHYDETYKVFESVRCEPWLSSGFPVLTESSLDDDPRAITVPYEYLVDKACEIIESIDYKEKCSNIVFYCSDLEMRNPIHYDTYEIDRDIYIYNMALECKNKGYDVTIYSQTIFTEYNGILFKNPKKFDPDLDIRICILFPPFTQTFLSSLKNKYLIFICVDIQTDLSGFILDNVSRLFFESNYIRSKYKYLPDNKCSILYNTLHPIISSVERCNYKILCTQPYNEELFNLIYSFWPYIKSIMPHAQFLIVSDPSTLSISNRQFIHKILNQDGIIEMGLLSEDKMHYEKMSCIIHINLSSTRESIKSIEESIELGCIPILSNIYKNTYGIHINEPTRSQKCIQQLIKHYISLINTDSLLINQYIQLLKGKISNYSNDSLIDKIENYLDPKISHKN
jgi:hypothetical protein